MLVFFLWVLKLCSVTFEGSHSGCALSPLLLVSHLAGDRQNVIFRDGSHLGLQLDLAVTLQLQVEYIVCPQYDYFANDLTLVTKRKFW